MIETLAERQEKVEGLRKILNAVDQGQSTDMGCMIDVGLYVDKHNFHAYILEARALFEQDKKARQNKKYSISSASGLERDQRGFPEERRHSAAPRRDYVPVLQQIPHVAAMRSRYRFK